MRDGALHDQRYQNRAHADALPPLTLRIAVGHLGEATVGDTPVFSRELVRIDFATQDHALEDALSKECKAEVAGIYAAHLAQSDAQTHRPAA